MGLDIPDDEIEAIADVLLPGVIKFFSSDESPPSLKRGRKNKNYRRRIRFKLPKIKYHNRHVIVTERRVNDRSNICSLFLGQSA